MKLATILLCASAMFVATGASAQVTVIGSQADLTDAGTIAQNTNFDNNGPYFTSPGDPYTVGNLTFVSASNLIGGQADYGLSRSLLTDNQITGTTVNINGSYNLFGFNAGNFFQQTTPSAISVTTNNGVYNFTPTVSFGVNPLTFIGFEAGAGEFISSVRYFSDGALGGTDFQIGTAATASPGAVPEPASWAMMILGMGAVGYAMRSAKRRSDEKFDAKIKRITYGAAA